VFGCEAWKRPLGEVIVTAGMIRSGSTWLYNAVRSLADGQFEAAGWHADLPERDGKYLLKIHEPSEVWAARARMILTTRRDLRDVAASLIAMNWNADVTGAIDAAVAAHAWWAERSALELPYEQIVGSPISALEALAGPLGVTVAEHGLRDVAHALDTMRDPTSESYDKTTLLHPGHRTDGRIGRWRFDLPATILDHIMAKHGDWLLRYN
jgi:hypothetical protein